MKRIFIIGRSCRNIIPIIVMMTLLFFASCAPAQSLPEAKRIVEIGDMEPLTGYGASSGQIVLMTNQDYVNYFNEEIGITGVSIELSWTDIGTEPGKAITASRRFIDGGAPLLLTSSSYSADACKSLCEKEETPLISPSTAVGLIYPPTWIYCIPPTYAEEFAVLSDFIMENWNEQIPPKMAFIVADSPWGREPLEQGTKYAESIGVEMLPPEFVPFVTLDATTQLLRLSDRAVDFVFIQGLAVTAGPVLKDAERLGLLSKIQFCGNEFGVGETLINMTGNASEGYLSPRSFPWLNETEIPGIKLMVDNQMKYHGKKINQPEYLSSVTTAVACEAIRRAVENVGYENIDGNAIKEALDNMKDFDVHGIISITFTPEDHRGSNKVAIYQIVDEEIMRLSAWREAPNLKS